MVLVADDEELDVNEGLCPAFGLTCGCILSIYTYLFLLGKAAPRMPIRWNFYPIV